MNCYFYLKRFVKRIVLTACIFFLYTAYAQSQPCDPVNIVTLSSCGVGETFTLDGPGVWNTSFCGFTVPGEEQIFSFTPTASGLHDLIITNSSGFIDYAWKDASLGCDEFNWTCIDDISSPATVSFGPLTAGVTYLILADNESETTARTHTISIGCPPPPCPTTFNAPFLDDYETNTNAQFTGFDNGWTSFPTSGFRWEASSSSDGNSSGTGPGTALGDHTSGSGIYMFTEASSGSTGDIAELISPCIELSTISNPAISFWYHMFGSNMGELHVDISTDEGTTWINDITTPIVGEQQLENDPWLERIVPLSAYAGQKVKIRLRGIRGTGFESDMSIDDFSIFSQPNIEIGITDLVQPVSDVCGFSASTPVEIQIINNGFATLDFSTDPATFTASITGPINSNINYLHNTGTVASGATVNIIIGNADLSANGSYNIDVNVSVTGDANASNDDLLASVTNSTASAPLLENFETFTGSTNATGLANGWTTIPSSTTAAFRWNPDAGGTPTGSTTGPSVDHTFGTSSGMYMFTEGTSGATGTVAELYSPCIDLTALTTPGFSFWYHMWGSNMGELHIDVHSGGTWNLDVAAPLIGQQQANQSDPWQEKVVSLTAFAGQQVIVRFRAVKGNGGSGDMAIDDFSVFELPSVDLGLTALINPVNGSCNLNSTTPVEVTVFNSGANTYDFAANPATFTAAITGPVNSNINYVHNTGTLAPFTSVSIVIGNADLSVNGNYTIDVTVAAPSDANSSNDNLTSIISRLIVIAPFLDDFEANSNSQFDGFANGWMSDPISGFRWEASSSSDGNSTGTGPGTALGDHTSGSGMYMFTEASSGSTGDAAELMSPCIDLNTLSNPTLSFWYHMFGIEMGELHVDVLSGGIWNLDVTAPLIGQQQLENDPWLERIVDLSSYIGQTIKVRFRGIRGTDFESDMSIDDVAIYNQTPVDIGIIALVNPVSYSCGFSSSTPVEITLFNTGNSTHDFSTDPATITASITGPVNSNLNFVHSTGTLAVGASVNIVIGNADFSAGGDYTVSLNSSVAADGNSLNDNLIKTITVAAIPHFEDFESFTNSTNATGLTNGWTTIPTGPTTTVFRWNPDAGGTPTGTTTGPGVDHTLGSTSGKYMFTESSSGGTGAIAELYSPCISLGTEPNPALSFWYHMWGSSMGELHVDVNAGGVWNIDVMTPLVGQQQANKTDPWLEMVVPLSAYVGQEVIVRFRGIRGAGTAGDMAIDDFSIFNQSTTDLGITALVNPVSNECGLSSNSPVEITLINSGLAPHDFTTNPATITATISGPVNSNINYVHNTGTLADGASIDIVIGNGDFSIAGSYTVDLNISVAGDNNNLNDDLTEVVVNNTVNIPYLEDFETFTNSTNATGLANGWTTDPSATTAAFRWNPDVGGTPTGSSTGPGVDHTLGTTAGRYMFTEASSGSTGDIAELFSPCIDLGSATNPTLVFWYHMWGVHMGELHVDVYSGGVWNLDVMTPLIGEQQVNKTDPWLSQTVSLAAYAGQIIQVRFRAVKGGGISGDMAIDDFQLYDQTTIDLGITNLVSPQSNTCGYGNSVPVEVTIVNDGLATHDFSIDPATITATITGPVISNINYVHSTGTLAQGASLNVVIGNADLSVDGTYNFDLNVSVTGDGVAFNDNHSASVNADNLIITAPYLEDFETFTNSTNATGLTNGWTNDPAGPTTSLFRWNPTSGTTPSTNTGPNVDHTLGTSAGKYMFTEASSGSLGSEAILYSPCIDLVSLANPTLSFWYHMYGADINELHVDVFSGGTWDLDVMAPILGEQQSDNSDPWLKKNVSLSAYNGQVVKIRFRAIRGGDFDGDIAIDDFRVFDQPPADLGITALVSPASESCDFSVSTPIEITIFNNGSDPFDFSSDPVDFTAVITGPVNSNILYTHSTGTIAPLSSANIIIGNADLSATGTYTIDLNLTAPGDGNSANDDFTAIVTNSTVTVFPHLEDFESFTTTTNATGLENGWTTDPSGTTGAFRWNPDAGGTPSSGTGPTVDHTLGTSAGIYMFTEATSGSSGDEAFLISPCIDLSSLSAPAMDFWYHMFGDDMEGGLHVDVYSGGVWDLDIMTPIVGQQQLQADPYLMQTVLLDAYTGERVQIRFRAIKGGSFEGDMAIDDINIYQQPPCDPLTLTAGTATISDDAGCGGDSVDLTLDGYSTGLGLTIQWEVSTDGGVTFTPIAGADNSTYTTDPLSGGTYIYQAVVSCSPNSATSNSVSVSITDPQIISTVGDTVCGIGEVTLSATASEGDIFWYDDINSITPIDTGSVLTTTINTTTTFYAAAVTGGGSTIAGALNSDGANGDYTLEAGLYFDVFAPFTIQTVHIYPIGSGTGTAELALLAPDGSVLQTYMFNGTGTSEPGIKTAVPVNFLVPSPGNQYAIVMLDNTGGITGLIRDNSANIQGSFPFDVPGLLSITSGRCCPSATSTSYYYFYEWIIGSGCESDKVAVTAVSTPAPVVEISGTSQICEGESSNLSITTGQSDYTSFEWSPATGLSSTSGATVTASPTTTTTYTVFASGNADGCQTEATFTVNVINVEVELTTDNSVVCGNEQAQLNTLVSAQTLLQNFANPDSILIPETGTGTGTGAPANPYPSVINVSGLPVNAKFNSVTLKGLHHTFADDIDIALVSPTNEVVILMSDIGSSFDLTGEIYTFSVGATSELNDVSTGNPSGIYLPTNAGINDDFPAPGPGDNFDQANPTLSDFVGDPNGAWSLYVVDDGTGDIGFITDGWELEFIDRTSVTYNWSPSTGLSATNIANPTSVPPTPGSSVTYTVVVTETISGCSATETITIYREDPVISSTDDDTRCGLGEVSLTATGSTGTIYWWEQSSGGQPVATGSPYEPFLTETTTFYTSTIAEAVNTTISTGFAGGTIATDPNAAGNMFDIVVQDNIILNSFDVHLNNNTSLAPSDISVYYKEGTYVGSHFDENAWTLVGSVSGVVSSGNNVPTSLPLNLDLHLEAGQTYGIYIVVTNLGVSNSLRYTSGANSPSLGAVAVEDQNIQLLTGTVIFGPFTGQLAAPTNRLWNGNVNYSLVCESPRVPVTGTVTPAPAVEVTGGPFVCENESVTLTVTTGDTDYTNFEWSPATGLSSTTGTSVVASPTQNTTYIVFASGNVNGCQNTDTIRLIVSPAPQVNVTADQTFFCDVANAQLDAGISSEAVFSNTSNITINTTGNADPYPSVINIGGIPSGATVAKVKLYGITHTFASDVDVVLVAPNNHAVVLFADQGSSTAFDAGIAELTIIDGGASFSSTLSAPFEYAPGSGTWSGGPIPDVITAFGSTLASFTGDYNGEWKLYVFDDGTGDGGNIAGGWSIEFNSVPPPSVLWSPSAGLSDPTIANPVATPTETTTYTAVVTNSITGCTSTDSVTIIVRESPTPVITSTKSMPLCEGESTILSTQYLAANGFQFSWNSGLFSSESITVNLPGTYDVVVTSPDGCTSTLVTFDVEVSTIFADILEIIDASCFGGSDGSVEIDVLGAILEPDFTIYFGPFDYSMNGGALQSSPLFTGLSAGTYTFTVHDPTTGCVLNLPATVGEAPEIVPGPVVINQNVSCNGLSDGSATVSATGGTGVLTYTWNTPVPKQGELNDEIPAGTWTVTITDENGCTATIEVTITELAVSFNVTDATFWNAENGAIEAIVSGGTPPYDYLWSTGATTSTIGGLSAGTYTLTITDDIGCVLVESVVVNEPPFECTDGKNITHTIQGPGGWGGQPSGNNPATYLYANFAAGFPNGLTIGHPAGTPGGCNRSITLTSEQAMTDFLPSAGQPRRLDPGHQVDITASQYGNIFASMTVALTLGVVFDTLDPNYSPLSTVAFGDMVYLGGGPYNGMTVYQILDAANEMLACGGRKNEISQLNTVIDNILHQPSVLGCPSSPVVRNITPELNTLVDDISINIYPNPTSGIVNISFESAEVNPTSIMIMDLQGRIVMQINDEMSNSFLREINLSSFDNGLYIINFMNENGIIKSSRISKVE